MTIYKLIKKGFDGTYVKNMRTSDYYIYDKPHWYKMAGEKKPVNQRLHAILQKIAWTEGELS